MQTFISRYGMGSTNPASCITGTYVLASSLYVLRVESSFLRSFKGELAIMIPRGGGRGSIRAEGKPGDAI